MVGDVAFGPNSPISLARGWSNGFHHGMPLHSNVTGPYQNNKVRLHVDSSAVILVNEEASSASVSDLGEISLYNEEVIVLSALSLVIIRLPIGWSLHGISWEGRSDAVLTSL